MSHESEGKKIKYGKRGPHITKEDGEFFLYVNEPEHPNDSLGTVSGGGPDQPTSILEITKDCPRKSYRYHVYRSVHHSLWDSDWVFSHHRIDMQSVTAKTHLSPRYLYRVFSERSRGVNTSDGFQSEAVKEGQGADMESMTEADVQENLRSHMRTKHIPSHWISFTTSPVWAVDRALRMKQRKHKEIHMAIIDTLQLAQPTKIFHAPALLAAHDVERQLRVVKNREAAEMLVWDELVGPVTLTPLQEFLKNCSIDDDGHVRLGLSELQPFHFKPLASFSKHSIEDAWRKIKTNPMKELRAPCNIRARNYKRKDEDKEHETEVRRCQASKLWRDKYTAGRMFHGKKLNNRWDENPRVPISDETICRFIAIVERYFPPEFQWPILLALLSNRQYHFEPSSVLEGMARMIEENDPLINPHGQKYECYVRDVASPNLPEVYAYEDLLRKCSERCGLAVKSLADLEEPRKYLTLEGVAYTRMPRLDQEAKDRADGNIDKIFWAQKRKSEEQEGEEKRKQKRIRAARARKEQRQRAMRRRRWSENRSAGPRSTLLATLQEIERRRGDSVPHELRHWSTQWFRMSCRSSTLMVVRESSGTSTVDISWKKG